MPCAGGWGCRWRCAGLFAEAPGARAGARYHQHVLPLATDVAEVERRFRRSSVLRGLRRARRVGLVAQRRTDIAALEAFFRLHVATRSRLGAPTQPRSFIRDLRRLFARDLGFVLLVTRGTETAAAAVFLHHAEGVDLQVRCIGRARAAPAAQQPPVLGGDPLGL